MIISAGVQGEVKRVLYTYMLTKNIFGLAFLGAEGRRDQDGSYQQNYLFHDVSRVILERRCHPASCVLWFMIGRVVSASFYAGIQKSDGGCR